MFAAPSFGVGLQQVGVSEGHLALSTSVGLDSVVLLMPGEERLSYESSGAQVTVEAAV